MPAPSGGWLKRIAALTAALGLVAGADCAQAQAAWTPSPPPVGVRAGAGAAFPQGHHAALDQLPDWGGIWFLEPRPGAAVQRPSPKGPYLDAYLKWRTGVVANHGEAKSSGSHCLPRAMPGIMAMPQYPYEFLFTPGRVTINQEAWMQVRRIWTDGRPHPADANPSFMGDSVGHWEGNALVVDTVSISADQVLVPGVRHSEHLRITERIALDPADRDQLIDHIEIQDPDALERPYVVTAAYRRDRFGRQLEFECAENDRNPVNPGGDTVFQ